MLLAAGADPRAVHKLEGFGGDIAPLVERPAHRGRQRDRQRRDGEDAPGRARRAAGEVRRRRLQLVVDRRRLLRRGARQRSPCASPTRSSGWARTSAPACTASRRSKATLDRIEPLIVAEMKTWEMRDPRAAAPGETKIVSPLMVHKASTVTSIQEAARAAGVKVLLEGGKVTGERLRRARRGGRPGRARAGDAGDDGAGRLGREGEEPSRSRTTEFFMPILVTMETATFDDFLRFSRRREPARPGHQPLDARRREAPSRAPHARRDAQGERRHRQRARVGGVRRERRRRERQHRAWATRRRPSRCSAAGRRAVIWCCEPRFRLGLGGLLESVASPA